MTTRGRAVRNNDLAWLFAAIECVAQPNGIGFLVAYILVTKIVG